MIPYLVILGGNSGACSAVEHLGSRGYNTLVLDRNPEAPARNVAARFVAVDFSNAKETEKATASFDFVGVMALNDFGVPTAAHLAAVRGLPGYDRQTAINVTNKVHMKRCWENAGLKIPKFTWARAQDVSHNEPLQWDHFPCIIKPAFSGGGSRGVYLVHNHADICRKLTESRSFYIDEEIIVEEYIPGTEHTLEVLIHEGETHLLNISDKRNYRGSASVVQELLFVGPIGRRYRKRLETLVSQASRALGLTNGCAHFEVLIRNDEIFLLEVGGRPGGGPNFHPICRLATGHDYPLELARVLTGERPTCKREPDTFCLGWHYFESPNGRLKEVTGFEELARHPAVVEARMFLEVDREAPELAHDLARPGYFLVKGKNSDDVQRLISELANTVTFRLEKGLHAAASP